MVCRSFSGSTIRAAAFVRLCSDAFAKQAEHDVVGVRVRELCARRKQQRVRGGETDESRGVDANWSSPLR
jgi:hypothetical protein